MQVGALFKHWSLRLLAPDRVLQKTYDAFKQLLAHDGRCHVLLAEFSALVAENRHEDCAKTRIRHRQLTESVLGMVDALAQMRPGAAGSLREYVHKYDFYIRLQLAPPERFLIPPFIVGHAALADPALVGGKSGHLLELHLGADVPVPAGFTITTTTFDLVLAHNHVRPALDLLLAAIDIEDEQGLERISQSLMTLVRHLDIPPQVEEEVLAAYDTLAASTAGEPVVAVRSSAQQEDGTYSFAGQYDSVLGVDRDGLFTAYLEVLASKYTPEALLYRIHSGLADEDAAMAVLVLTMVDGVAGGVVYTRDPTGSHENALLINSIHGLGAPLVHGEVVPEVFVVPEGATEPSLHHPGEQVEQLVLRGNLLVQEPYTGDGPSLAEAQVKELSALSRRIEAFYEGRPQDIEWVVDRQGALIILQARPLEMSTAPAQTAQNQPAPALENLPLCTGTAAARGVVAGLVTHGETWTDVTKELQILVTRHIAPSLVRHMDCLAAVVCEQGSVTGHFATVCREFGVVLLVGVHDAGILLPAGLAVTVDGEKGAVYAGRIPELIEWGERHAQSRKQSGQERISRMLAYITPLNLVDPQSRDFRPQSCRTMHDIIRYTHEMAVQAMFGLGEVAGGASSRSRKLATRLPIDIYLLDVGGAFPEAGTGKEINPQHLQAAPFLALWEGLTHPDIDWESHAHFDWQGFGDMALSGGIADGDSSQFASYAIVSPDYLNLNMRFGFHFTLIDCLCGAESRANHCQLRFAGGGGEMAGKSMRIVLLTRILSRLGFEVQVRGDLLDARLSGWPREDLLPLLVEVGRLLGMTKLLDMVLQEEDIDSRVDQFFEQATITHP